MNRFVNLTHDRAGRSAEDSYAASRVKLYKELRRLAELDAPVAKQARVKTVGGLPEAPAQPQPLRNS